MIQFRDPALQINERVTDLVARLSLEEKCGQLLHDAPAIERLDIPAYNWWNECLHGVARAGLATVFPQGIGMGATWNVPLLSQVATAISDEARAKHHAYVRRGWRGMNMGLTFWTPNINIFRDPRWGRGQETYGEDPYLMARMGVAFVKALQGDDPHYLKLVATPKHFAVHSGPESERHSFDALASQYDLWDTYLPAFEATVVEGKAASVMGAYNRTNGEVCCGSVTLLQDILRDRWGFEGYVVSDCGGIIDFYRTHKVVDTPAEAAAMAVKNGCELNCGETYHALLEAHELGLISEAEIDIAVGRLMTARMRLGMFDPPERVPYAAIPYEVVDSAENKHLAHHAALESIVLLKNDGILPLAPDTQRIAVIGPNADDAETLLGNYFGTPSNIITPLDGIRTRANGSVSYARGCHIAQSDWDSDAAAELLARESDVVIFCGGLSQLLEGEEGATTGGDLDRPTLGLPTVQQTLLEKLHATGTPVVLVLINGSALSVNWADAHLPAIVEAWYPGQSGGAAIAQVLFGDYNPAGRLPVTVYKSADDLPPITDYDMSNRTYRYFKGEPLYQFGYGLSYTTFEYSHLHLASSLTENEPLTVRVQVSNSGDRAGDEVVQVYWRHVSAEQHKPLRQLAGFERIHLDAGTSQSITITLKPEQLTLVNAFGERKRVTGEIEVLIGGGQTFLRQSVLLV
ncbi:MAG: glycoside hydrolase family 3 C-terminal domain-containing protein [Candidatus Promineifilaceae bacterium]